MGQPVTVLERPTATPDVVRYETNRNLTGMGHEIFRTPDAAVGDTPAAELARRLFAHGGVQSVHVYQNIATVQFQPGASRAGVTELIEELYLYYTEGVEVEIPEGAAAD